MIMLDIFHIYQQYTNPIILTTHSHTLIYILKSHKLIIKKTSLSPSSDQSVVTFGSIWHTIPEPYFGKIHSSTFRALQILGVESQMVLCRNKLKIELENIVPNAIKNNLNHCKPYGLGTLKRLV